jgi:predicted metalloprotease with PDZ domain
MEKKVSMMCRGSSIEGLKNFIKICVNIAGREIRSFIESCVEVKTPLPYIDVGASCGFHIQRKYVRTIPFLGVRTEEKTIVWVIPGSPAETGGLQKYDEIFAIGANPVFGEISPYIAGLRIGQHTSVSIMRHGKAYRIPVVLGSQTISDFRFDEISDAGDTMKTIRDAFYDGSSGF